MPTKVEAIDRPAARAFGFQASLARISASRDQQYGFWRLTNQPL